MEAEEPIAITIEEKGTLEEIRALLPDHIRSRPEAEQSEFLMHIIRQRRRQKEMHEIHDRYLAIVKEHYKHKHAHLLELRGWGIDPEVAKSVATGSPALSSLLQPLDCDGLYKGRFLSAKTCRELVEEVAHFEKWSLDRGLRVERPNSMNNYGAVLDDLGFYPALQELTETYANAFATLLYPHLGATLDGHHGFVVEYELGKDVKLDFHVDDSELTLNVCLGNVFKGGALRFGGIRCPLHQQTGVLPYENKEIQHDPGSVLIHLGRHRHQALEIISGHRVNLILWCRSQTVRSAPRYMVCEGYCGLHESNLKAVHDRFCNCGNFEQHKQPVMVEEEYYSSSSGEEMESESDNAGKE